jgi:hypothetical protein
MVALGRSNPELEFQPLLDWRGLHGKARPDVSPRER